MYIAFWQIDLSALSAAAASFVLFIGGAVYSMMFFLVLK
jgi:hypothetical protein